jgi:hypothetical protein
MNSFADSPISYAKVEREAVRPPFPAQRSAAQRSADRAEWEPQVLVEDL